MHSANSVLHWHKHLGSRTPYAALNSTFLIQQVRSRGLAHPVTPRAFPNFTRSVSPLPLPHFLALFGLVLSTRSESSDFFLFYYFYISVTVA